MSDLWGIVANVKTDRALRTGAKVWLCISNGSGQSWSVYGISKSGRYISKYARLVNLEKFRSRWIPEHLRDRVGLRFSDRSDADALAARLTDPISRAGTSPP